MLLTNEKIAIIGAGPGGLTLARLLQIKGLNVTVYERDVNDTARVQGATLDLHYGSGLKAIEVAGLLDEFKAAYRPGNEMGRVLDKHAHILYDQHEEAPNGGFGDPAFRPEIDRGPLRDILLGSLSPGTVVWDSYLTQLAVADGQWSLKFNNGRSETVDLVIGADGANSKVRPLVTTAQPYYAGIFILQGNIEHGAANAPNIHCLLKDGKLYVHGDQRYIHISSKGDGSIDFYISCKKDKDWVQESGIDFSDREQVLSWFQQEFQGWDEVWSELLGHVGLPLYLRPQYCIPQDQHWEAKPNVTLLGDAAHIMPPSGEGVNLAMLDAVDLSECLTGEQYADLRSAIAAYEEKMCARGAGEAKDSLEMSAWMHSEQALDTLVQMLSGN